MRRGRLDGNSAQLRKVLGQGILELAVLPVRTSIFGKAPTQPLWKLKIPDEAMIATIKAWQGGKLSQVVSKKV